MFNSKSISLIVSFLITFINTGFLFLFKSPEYQILIIVALLSFSSSWIFTYLSLEYVAFHEIDKIYDLLKKIKKKDYKATIERKSRNSLIKGVNDEIFAFIDDKQEEVENLTKIVNFRKEFMADLSHEFKTPIFAAQGYIHTLLDGAMDDERVREKFLQKAATNLDALNELVQDLISLSLIEIGEISMQEDNFDLLVLLKEVFDQLEGKALNKNTKLILITESNRVWTFGDRARIRQIFVNLIDNAIKYGNFSGTVEVFVEKEKENISIKVKDDGPGIAEQHQNRIFERFYRIDKSRSKEHGGSGLGLAIVEHIITAHKSKISVFSKDGNGTIFQFKLKRGVKPQKQNDDSIQGPNY